MIIFSEEFVEHHGLSVAVLFCFLALFMWWEWPNIARGIFDEFN